MKEQTMTLLIVGIISSVAASAIMMGIDRWIDKRGSDRSGESYRLPGRRNEILAGIGRGAAFA